MIVSRTLAKGRIDRGARPSWIMAWGPVLADAAILAAVLAWLWGPVMQLVRAMAWPNAVTFALLFAVFFIPAQVVMILSSLWAAKSRWSDDPTPKADP